MSTTYSIACQGCRTHLWIAQSSCGSGHVYTTPEHAAALYEFLSAHRGHPLVYDENCETEIVEFEEIDVPPSRGRSTVEAVDQIRDVLAGLPPAHRLVLFEHVEDGYCRDCGGDKTPCHCTNDE